MTRKSYRRRLAALVLIRTLGELGLTAMLPFVVLWAHRDAGLLGTLAGVLFVVQALGEFSAGLLGGAIADRLGHRRLLLLATGGMALGYGLLSVARAPVPAILLFLLAGLFESAFHPNIGALVGDVVPQDKLIHAFGALSMGANAGRVAGPLIGAAAALLSLSCVFAVSGGLLLAALVTGLFLLPRDLGDVAEEDDDPEFPPGTLTALRRDRLLGGLVLIGGVLAVTYAWWESDGLIILRHQHPLSTTGFAALFTIAAAVTVVFQLPVTRLLARRSSRGALVAGAGLQAAGLAVLIFAASGYAVLVVSTILLALGGMVYGPTLSTLVAVRAGQTRRASYMAALSISQDIGTAVGPVSGLALAGLGAVPVWVIGALSGAVAAAGLGLTSPGRHGSGRSGNDRRGGVSTVDPALMRSRRGTSGARS